MQKIIKPRTFIIACLFLLVLSSFRLLWLSLDHSSEQPKVIQGVLDLTQLDTTIDKTFNLDGEWEFFPNTFLSPEESESTEGKPLAVPGKWNEYFSKQKVPAFGYGTYRLKILVPREDSNQEFGIRFYSIQTASKLFVNGQASDINGNPSINPATHKTSTLLTTSIVKPNQSGEIELLIHVSNYDNGVRGGIDKSIGFGSLHALNKKTSYSSTMQFLVFVIMLIHSLYALILFSLRPRRIELLYFALGIFFFSFCIVLDDDRLLLNVLSIEYEWYVKLLKFAYIAMTACLLQFFNHMFLAVHKSKILDYLSIICVISGFIIIVLPAQYETYTNYIILLLVISFSIITFLVYKLIVTDNRDVLLILLSTISALSSLVWGISRSLGIVHYSSFYPYDLIFAIVTFSTYWFKQFFQDAEEKEKLYTKLKQEDQLKDQFLANTSHELRNPLHGIINITESIMNDKSNQMNQHTKANLELLITISRRMSLMLNDLIDFTHIKEKGILLKLEGVNIKAISSGVIDMFQFMIVGKPVKFVIDIPTHFPSVLADKNRLIQILYNLVHNAVKYTNEGVISIHADYKNDKARIHVADTGIGISEQLQNKIFEPYEQGISGNHEGGIGLGLSISKQLVEMHGGTLSVESTPEKGSTFTFTLQLAENIRDRRIQQENLITTSSHKLDVFSQYTFAYEDEDTTHLRLSGQSTNRPRILAVDDDAVNLKVLASILPPDEYNLVTVTNGKEALSHLNRNEWDLIIADVMMPSMSGYELTRIIRKEYLLTELPILLLIARSDINDIVTGFLSGANDYVTKPINSIELKARVKALTNLKQSISEQLRIEAAWLQAQIQPHFLFNTLNTIASLGEIDSDRMTRLLEKFGHYLQKSFDPINLQRSVPLNHELELIKAYLYIEQERFGEKLHVEWKVDPDIQLHIPPLSIQTLVENALRHGILKQVNGGTLLIEITNFKEFTEVMVHDNGVGMDEKTVNELLADKSQITRGIGLVNTNKRLKQAFGTELTIKSTIGKGTSVTFHIPNKRNNECRN